MTTGDEYLELAARLRHLVAQQFEDAARARGLTVEEARKRIRAIKMVYGGPYLPEYESIP